MSFLYSDFEPETDPKYKYIGTGTGKQDYGFFTPIENSKQNSLDNLVIQSTTDETSNTKQFMTYYQDPTQSQLNDHNDTPKTEPDTTTSSSESDSEDWSPINHFYIGSLTVIGLFLIFRLIQKN